MQRLFIFIVWSILLFRHLFLDISLCFFGLFFYLFKLQFVAVRLVYTFDSINSLLIFLYSLFSQLLFLQLISWWLLKIHIFSDRLKFRVTFGFVNLLNLRVFVFSFYRRNTHQRKLICLFGCQVLHVLLIECQVLFGL